MVPLVSIIIPTYNRAALVPAAVASVMAQTFRDFEILVADDGSTAATPETLAPWEGVTVIRRSSRKGVAAARNLSAA
jgi:glycosyltransferase involved in cell wall biosynthesis